MEEDYMNGFDSMIGKRATEKSVEDGTENMEDAKFKVKEETEYALYNSRLLPQSCITESQFILPSPLQRTQVVVNKVSEKQHESVKIGIHGETSMKTQKLYVLQQKHADSINQGIAIDDFIMQQTENNDNKIKLLKTLTFTNDYEESKDKQDQLDSEYKKKRDKYQIADEEVASTKAFRIQISAEIEKANKIKRKSLADYGESVRRENKADGRIKENRAKIGGYKYLTDDLKKIMPKIEAEIERAVRTLQQLEEKLAIEPSDFSKLNITFAKRKIHLLKSKGLKTDQLGELDQHYTDFFIMKKLHEAQKTAVAQMEKLANQYDSLLANQKECEAEANRLSEEYNKANIKSMLLIEKNRNLEDVESGETFAMNLAYESMVSVKNECLAAQRETIQYLTALKVAKYDLPEKSREEFDGIFSKWKKEGSKAALDDFYNRMNKEEEEGN